MDQNLDNYASSESNVNIKASMRVTKIGQEKRLNQCNRCDYASVHASAVRTHLKTHSGEKPNKCNQCNFASIQAGNLRTHLKTHKEERSNK